MSLEKLCVFWKKVDSKHFLNYAFHRAKSVADTCTKPWKVLKTEYGKETSAMFSNTKLLILLVFFVELKILEFYNSYNFRKDMEKCIANI